MKRTFHLVGAEEWQPAGGLWCPASLEGQGFVHLSFAEQLQGTLDLHFPGRGPLWLLEVDPGALEDLVLEPSREDQLFPHLYGPLPAASVLRHWSLVPADGRHLAPTLGAQAAEDEPAGKPGQP